MGVSDIFAWLTQWRVRRACSRDGHIYSRGKLVGDKFVKTCRLCKSVKAVKRRKVGK